MNKPVSEASKSNVAYFFGILFILCLGSLLRIYGIGWGLPTLLHPDYSYHPDETAMLACAQLLAQGKLIAKEFMYGGTFYFLILRACIYFGDKLSGFLGGFNLLADTILITRYFQVFIAVLTMLVVYECGRLLYDRKAGLVAALLLAIAPAHIIATQTVRPDVIGAFLVILIVFVAAKLLKSERADHRKILIYSGVIIGATAAFRSPLAGFGLLPMMSYIFSRRRANGRAISMVVRDQNVLWLIATIVLAYVVFSPHTFMYPRIFVSGLKVQLNYETSVFPNAIGRGPILFQYAWRILRQALGYPGYYLSLGGIVYSLVRHGKADIIVLTGICLYLIMLVSVTWVLVRYTLPMLPLLALLGGAAVSGLVERARNHIVRRMIYLIAAVLLAWALASDLAFLRVVASKNVRDQVTDWMTQNVQPGKSILELNSYSGDYFFNPVIPRKYNNWFLTLSNDHATLTNEGDSHALFSQGRFNYVIINEILYADIARLGKEYPNKQAWELYELLTGGKSRLVKEFKEPVKFLGVDFSGSFEAVDYSIVNPGIRIYQSQ
ncbi:MAG: glycosyltransferase family 39 protein [Sulfuricaulis sp.]